MPGAFGAVPSPDSPFSRHIQADDVRVLLREALSERDPARVDAAWAKGETALALLSNRLERERLVESGALSTSDGAALHAALVRARGLLEGAVSLHRRQGSAGALKARIQVRYAAALVEEVRLAQETRDRRALNQATRRNLALGGRALAMKGRLLRRLRVELDVPFRRPWGRWTDLPGAAGSAARLVRVLGVDLPTGRTAAQALLFLLRGSLLSVEKELARERKLHRRLNEALREADRSYDLSSRAAGEMAVLRRGRGAWTVGEARRYESLSARYALETARGNLVVLGARLDSRRDDFRAAGRGDEGKAAVERRVDDFSRHLVSLRHQAASLPDAGASPLELAALLGGAAAAEARLQGAEEALELSRLARDAGDATRLLGLFGEGTYLTDEGWGLLQSARAAAAFSLEKDFGALSAEAKRAGGFSVMAKELSRAARFGQVTGVVLETLLTWGAGKVAALGVSNATALARTGGGVSQGLGRVAVQYAALGNGKRLAGETFLNAFFAGILEASWRGATERHALAGWDLFGRPVYVAGGADARFAEGFVSGALGGASFTKFTPWGSFFGVGIRGVGQRARDGLKSLERAPSGNFLRRSAVTRTVLSGGVKGLWYAEGLAYALAAGEAAELFSREAFRFIGEEDAHGQAAFMRYVAGALAAGLVRGTPAMPRQVPPASVERTFRPAMDQDYSLFGIVAQRNLLLEPWAPPSPAGRLSLQGKRRARLLRGVSTWPGGDQRAPRRFDVSPGAAGSERSMGPFLQSLAGSPLALGLSPRESPLDRLSRQSRARVVVGLPSPAPPVNFPSLHPVPADPVPETAQPVAASASVDAPPVVSEEELSEAAKGAIAAGFSRIKPVSQKGTLIHSGDRRLQAAAKFVRFRYREDGLFGPGYYVHRSDGSEQTESAPAVNPDPKMWEDLRRARVKISLLDLTDPRTREALGLQPGAPITSAMALEIGAQARRRGYHGVRFEEPARPGIVSVGFFPEVRRGR